MQIIMQTGVDDLPFVHQSVPSYVRSASGLDVPCDGPRLLALDDASGPVCAGCNAPVVRAGPSAQHPAGRPR